MLGHTRKTFLDCLTVAEAAVELYVVQKMTGLRILLLLLGLIAVASSWFSIRPSSEHRYQSLLARHEANPESVSAEEWVMSKDDEGMTALVLLVLGVPAFVVVSVAAGVFSKIPHKPQSTCVFVGVAWLMLGGALHALVWAS